MTAARSDCTPVHGDFADEPLLGERSIRIDDRKRRPAPLMTAKALAESNRDWDDFKLVATIKPEDAWRPLDKGGCPFVKA